MNKLQHTCVGLLVLICLSCSATREQHIALPMSFEVTVENPIDVDRTDEFVVIPEEEIISRAADFNPQAFAVFDGDTEIASQYNFNDAYHRGIVLVLDLPSEGARQLTIRYHPEGSYVTDYTKRTQAELSHKVGGRWVDREYEGGTFQDVNFLRVPPEHKDHSWFIRYEGPGWESDKVGYRFYLDQRNATDVFGKKTSEVVLQKVGLDGFDSYHEMQDWGMDVMKVGPTLGVGSPGAWLDGKITRIEKTDSVTCEIQENGPVYSSVLTTYYGWAIGEEKFTVKSHLSIHAGTRVTVQTLELDRDTDILCTGIGKDPKAGLFTHTGDDTRLSWLATYGPQSLNQDDLGLSVFYSPAVASGVSEDVHNHAVTLKSQGQRVRYFFIACWSGEPGGISSRDAFEAHLNEQSRRLANPVKVTFSSLP